MTVTSLDQVTEFPLTWPQNKPRAAQRRSGAFQVSMAKAQADLERELGAWRVRRWVLSMAPRYRHTLADPAVALWFYMPSKAPIPTAADLRVIACDRYQLVEHNLRAIGLTLEALRGVDRHGAYSMEQATEGARALPPPASATPAVTPWWDILGVERGWPLGAAELAYRSKAEKAHPDRGGSAEAMAALNQAIADARKEMAGG